MSFYGEQVFPRVMDFLMGNSELGKLRKKLLAGVRGKTLEVGIGTGLNLPYYPKAVRTLTAVDVNRGMRPKARKRMKETGRKVDYRILSGERLPFPDGSFDNIVSTFTLCSIPDAQRALKEFRRVLKKNGKLFFLEHGRSRDRFVVFWQDLLNPINKVLGEGCHLNRDIKALIRNAGFRFRSLKTYYFPKIPKPVGFYYQGIASVS